MKTNVPSLDTTVSSGCHPLTERILALPVDKFKTLVRQVRKNKAAAGGALEKKSSPLVAIRSLGMKLPLFLLHPVGGGVQPYFQLAEYLDNEQPVYALQNHEFGSHHEHPYTPIEKMAAEYIDAIRTVQHAGPYSLAGWSMGGIVAFEMAFQLRQQNHEVRSLIMIDAPAQFASGRQLESPNKHLARGLVLLGKIWAHQKTKNFTVTQDELEQLDADRQLDSFIRAVKVCEIVAPEADDAALRAAIKTFINNNRACENYVPKMYAGHLIVIRAMETQQETKQDTLPVFDDPSFGWQTYCTHAVTVRHVPGDHMFMMLEPHVQSLAAALQTSLDHPVTD